MRIAGLRLDSLIAFIAIVQIILFIIFLFSKRKKKISNYLLASFLICQVIIWSKTILEQAGITNYYYYIFIAFFVWLVSPLLYLYVLSVTNPNFKLKASSLIHGIAAVVFLLLTIIGSKLIPDVLFRPNFISILLLPVITYIQFAIYSIHSLRAINHYKLQAACFVSSVNEYDLKWLKLVIWGFMVAWFSNAVIAILAGFEIIQFASNFYLIPEIFFILFFNILFFKGWSTPQVFDENNESTRYLTSRLSQEKATVYLEMLSKFMSDKKPYLNPELRLKDIADELDIPLKYLSQVINEKYNQNFFDFINFQRIEEAKRIILSTSEKKNALQLMYEAGFNSKSSFNTAFKKFTGMTPTEFKISVKSEK